MVLSLVSFFFYMVSGILLMIQLFKKNILIYNGLNYISSGLALLFHAVILSKILFTTAGLNFSFYNVLSLLAFMMVIIILMISVYKPIESLGVVVFPGVAITVMLCSLFPGQHILPGSISTPMQVHIFTSILAYSLLAIAAGQSLLLYIQNHYLHNRMPGGFIRKLPSLNTMELILMQMLLVGFLLLTVSLISGFMFLDNMFIQHKVHKTVLSIIAWVVFGILLWGRWRYGWRGKLIVKLTLGGFFSLVLAYLGSKYVIEMILHR